MLDEIVTHFVAPLGGIVVAFLLIFVGGVVIAVFNEVSKSLGFDEARRRRIMRRWRWRRRLRRWWRRL